MRREEETLRFVISFIRVCFSFFFFFFFLFLFILPHLHGPCLDVLFGCAPRWCGAGRRWSGLGGGKGGGDGLEAREARRRDGHRPTNVQPPDLFLKPR